MAASFQSVPNPVSAPDPPLAPVARRTKAAAAGLHLVFEPRAPTMDDASRSAHSSPSVCSPYPLTPEHGPERDEPDVANDDCWNLIPYNVPWGHEYYAYEAGTLPGPDGTACMFLRSPTPLKNRRTATACNRCRERKAKCSGAHPTCARCLARGYVCEYVEDPKRARGPALGRQRRRDSAPCGSDSASSAGSSDYAPSMQSLSPKREESEELMLYGDLTYPSPGDSSEWAQPAEQDSPMLEDGNGGPLSTSYFRDTSCDGRYAPSVHDAFAHAGSESFETYASAPLHSGVPAEPTYDMSPSVRSPHPLKCEASAPFLSGDAYMDSGLELQQGADAASVYSYSDVPSVYSQLYEDVDGNMLYTPVESAYLPPYNVGADAAAQHFAAVTAYHREMAAEAATLYSTLIAH